MMLVLGNPAWKIVKSFENGKPFFTVETGKDITRLDYDHVAPTYVSQVGICQMCDIVMLYAETFNPSIT